jgi:hypothetical protein
MDLPSHRTERLTGSEPSATQADIAGARPTSISFAGCAWLVAYHFGVGAALQARGWLDGSILVGASSGALVAAALASGLDATRCYEETLACTLRVAHRPLGPAGAMSAIVYDALERMLPDDAHLRVRGRFFASVTSLPILRSHLMPHDRLHDKRDLISLVLASCYIPLYYERPALWRNRPYVDGGLRNNQPIIDGSTLTVSPFSKAKVRALISPQTQASPFRSLLPNRRSLDALFEQGVGDAQRFMARSSELPGHGAAHSD